MADQTIQFSMTYDDVLLICNMVEMSTKKANVIDGFKGILNAAEFLTKLVPYYDKIENLVKEDEENHPVIQKLVKKKIKKFSFSASQLLVLNGFIDYHNREGGLIPRSKLKQFAELSSRVDKGLLQIKNSNKAKKKKNEEQKVNNKPEKDKIIEDEEEEDDDNEDEDDHSATSGDDDDDDEKLKQENKKDNNKKKHRKHTEEQIKPEKGKSVKESNNDNVNEKEKQENKKDKPDNVEKKST